MSAGMLTVPAGARVVRFVPPLVVSEQEITEALENCLYEFLPSGFEINDGGQGTLTIDVETAKVTLHHQENYTAINETTQEFTL